MPGLFTNVGADRLFAGLFDGGVYVSLHTNSPPTEANKIQDSWYSDVQEAANAWSEHDDGNFREVDNDSDIEFGTTPAAGALSDAEAVAIASASVMSAANLLWYDDDPSVDIQNNRNVKIDAAELRIQIDKVGVVVTLRRKARKARKARTAK